MAFLARGENSMSAARCSSITGKVTWSMLGAVLDDVTDQNSGINLTDQGAKPRLKISPADIWMAACRFPTVPSAIARHGDSSTSNGAVSLSASTLEQNGGNGINILAPAADVTITTSVIESNHGMGVKDDAAETQITQTASSIIFDRPGPSGNGFRRQYYHRWKSRSGHFRRCPPYS